MKGVLAVIYTKAEGNGILPQTNLSKDATEDSQETIKPFAKDTSSFGPIAPIPFEESEITSYANLEAFSSQLLENIYGGDDALKSVLILATVIVLLYAFYVLAVEGIDYFD